jgi:Protein of unknown function (DUF3611)
MIMINIDPDNQFPTPHHPTQTQSGPKASLYLTLVGILAGFLSTFWNFGYQRTAARMQEYLDGAPLARVRKQEVSSHQAALTAA